MATIFEIFCRHAIKAEFPMITPENSQERQIMIIPERQVLIVPQHKADEGTPIKEVDPRMAKKTAQKQNQRSIKYRIEKAVNKLRSGDLEYIVVDRILSTQCENSYKKWLDKKHSMPDPSQFPGISRNKGRKYYEL